LGFLRDDPNRETQEGRLEWRVEDQHDLLASDVQRFGPVYATEAQQARIRLYKERMKYEAGETYDGFWEETIVLEVKPHGGGDFIRIPRLPGLDDLYETVVYKTHQVEDFLKRFLNKA
jgi:hypothetical protein